MFGTGGCKEVWSSIFWAQRRRKREHQMKGYVTKLLHQLSDRAWGHSVIAPINQRVDRRGLCQG